MEQEIRNLILAAWRDAQRSDFWLESLVLAVALLIAWLVQRLARKPSGTEDKLHEFGRVGLRRVAFPLTALVLVLIARPVLRIWHQNVDLLNIAVPLLGSLALVRATVFALRHAFAPSGWLATFEKALATVVWGVVALHIVGWLDPIIEHLEQISFPVGKVRLDLWLVLQGAFTVLATVLMALWIGGVIEDRLMRATALDSNVRLVLSRLSKALLITLAVLIGLPIVGIDLTALSVFGGALGVGLGFGLQKVASNYVSGFIILLDRSIRLGNVIEVDRFGGEVTQITTRYTVLRGLTGVEAIVPNEMLFNSVVTNQTYTHTQVRVAVQVQVGYQSDLDQAMQIIVDAARQHPRVLADPPPRAFLVSFGDSGINLELGFWIADPGLGTLDVRSAIHLAIWQEFQHAGIQIPFPQREVHVLAPASPRPVPESL